MTANRVEFDIEAAQEWLRGDIKKGSPRRELQARQSLAWRLRTLTRKFRSSSDKALLYLLADAIDPDGEGGQRLIMKRKRGRRQRSNALDIAVFVWRRKQADLPMKVAVDDAMQEFAVKRTTVTAAWSKWGPHIERRPKSFALL